MATCICGHDIGQITIATKGLCPKAQLMTRNRELDLQDIVDCAHEPELPVTENGAIIGYACRCGRYTPINGNTPDVEESLKRERRIQTMATKRTGVPCYDKAGEDEPLFVLRATDKFGPQVIRYWAALVVQGCEPDVEEPLKRGKFPTPEKVAQKVLGAHQCAETMEDWQERHPDKVKVPD